MGQAAGWSKRKGYVTGYRVVQKLYPRESEPTILLITDYSAIPSNAEIERRSEEYVATMKMDEHARDAAAKNRGPMRAPGSQTMLQKIIMKWSNAAMRKGAPEPLPCPGDSGVLRVVYVRYAVRATSVSCYSKC